MPYNNKLEKRKAYTLKGAVTIKKTVVITGASDGIGLATAKRFLSEGMNVINLSRRPSEANGIINISTDVTDDKNVKASFEQIKKDFGKIDILINNAGFGIAGAVEYTDIDEAKRQFDVNFFGMVSCTKAALPMLRISGGRIINISSAASIFSIPFQSFYSASKASVDSVTKALASELKGSGVTVCALRLGDVKTSFTAQRKKSYAGDEEYKGMISRSVKVMEHDEENGMPPEIIADAVFKASIRKNQPVISTVGIKYKLFTAVNKMLPSEIVNDVIALIYMPKG